MKSLEYDELLQLKEVPAQELPESVRMRLGETYLMLEDMTMAEPEQRKKRSWARRSILIVSGTAAAFLLLIGSGFVSPVMAQALKQIPFLESVFKMAGDRGLQIASDEGMTVKMDQSVTHNGVTVTLSELIYDGSRLNLVLTRDKLPEENSSDEANWDYRTTLGLKYFEFYVNGSWVNTSLSISRGGSEAPNSIIVSALNSPGINIPDEFELKFRFTLRDQPTEPFEFKLPVKKTDNSTVITPDEIKDLDHVRMGIEKLKITPVTTQLEVEIRGDQGQLFKEISKLVPDKFKNGDFINIECDIADDKGNLQNEISGNGSGEKDYMRYVYSYEPFEEIPEFATIKPYVRIPETGGQKYYIPEFEFKIQVK